MKRKITMGFILISSLLFSWITNAANISIEAIEKMSTKELKSNMVSIIMESKKLERTSQDALLLSIGDKLSEEDKNDLYKQKDMPLDDRIFASKAVRDLEKAVLKLKKEKNEETPQTLAIGDINMAGTSPWDILGIQWKTPRWWSVFSGNITHSLIITTITSQAQIQVMEAIWYRFNGINNNDDIRFITSFLDSQYNWEWRPSLNSIYFTHVTIPTWAGYNALTNVINYAKAQDSKPYPPSYQIPTNKYLTSSFYCSQLIWRSYKDYAFLDLDDSSPAIVYPVELLTGSFRNLYHVWVNPS